MKDLTYEECLALKEAGFPQNPNKHSERPDSWIDSKGELLDFQSGVDETEVYCPTTDELIEELVDKKRKTGGLIMTVTPTETAVTCYGKYSEKDTLKSALCNLYLAIHKK
jgi:hypothetical protein